MKDDAKKDKRLWVRETIAERDEESHARVVVRLPEQDSTDPLEIVPGRLAVEIPLPPTEYDWIQVPGPKEVQ